jgi:hypothetical protein
MPYAHNYCKHSAPYFQAFAARTLMYMCIRPTTGSLCFLQTLLLIPCACNKGHTRCISAVSGYGCSAVVHTELKKTPTVIICKMLAGNNGCNIANAYAVAQSNAVAQVPLTPTYVAM